jgi:hypothetical protein
VRTLSGILIAVLAFAAVWIYLQRPSPITVPAGPEESPAPSPSASASSPKHQEAIAPHVSPLIPATEAPRNVVGPENPPALPKPSPPGPLKDVRLRDAQGNYRFSGMDDALKACQAQHMRLPTIRELAKLAHAQGAKGIREARDLREQDEAEGYQLVRSLSADGKPDEFLYSPLGYSDPIRSDFGLARADDQRAVVHGPNDPPERLLYWSSSESLGHHDEADPNLRSFYVLDAHGRIHDHYRSVIGLVRCVSDP